MARARDWATPRLRAARAAGPIPRMGSADWAALPAGDVRRWGAVIVAALCWLSEGSTLPERLRAELDAARAADDRRDAEAHASVAAGVRATADRPTVGELARRRGEVTETEFEDWAARHAEFTAGITDEPARLPRRGSSS